MIDRWRRRKYHITNTCRDIRMMLAWFGVMAAIIIAAAACGSSAQSAKSATEPNDAVHSSVQSIEVDGHFRRYVCFTYTTVDRGGIWCERVSVR